MVHKEIEFKEPTKKINKVNYKTPSIRFLTNKQSS